MEFLFSNLPPLRLQHTKTFYDVFYDLLSQSSELDIAVGYISSDSIVALQKTLVDNNKIENLNLIIGMHYLEKFTEPEYRATMTLNEYLQKNNRGEVRLVNTFKYHGKIYTYKQKGNTFAGIIGSNNLSGIVNKNIRTYEASALFTDSDNVNELQNFIIKLSESSTKRIDELIITEFNVQNKLLEGHENVEKLSAQDVVENLKGLTSTTFEIPIKTYETAPSSNLNVFFGKGREGQNGLVIPRHWYEVELIVPQKIATQNGYPVQKTEEACFDVFTDDGWKFKCKISGDYNKNFRSEDDLKILGKWIKGRLENSGCLQIGQPVTKDTLEKYGRNTLTFTKTNKPNLWYLDFKVDK